MAVRSAVLIAALLAAQLLGSCVAARHLTNSQQQDVTAAVGSAASAEALGAAIKPGAVVSPGSRYLMANDKEAAKKKSKKKGSKDGDDEQLDAGGHGGSYLGGLLERKITRAEASQLGSGIIPGLERRVSESEAKRLGSTGYGYRKVDKAGAQNLGYGQYDGVGIAGPALTQAQAEYDQFLRQMQLDTAQTIIDNGKALSDLAG